MTGKSAVLTAPPEHPAYAGHFPGNPVVPGVMLLDLIQGHIGRGAPLAVPNVKFHRALHPGETIELTWINEAQGARFRCTRAGELIADGSLRFSMEAPAT